MPKPPTSPAEEKRLADEYRSAWADVCCCPLSEFHEPGVKDFAEPQRPDKTTWAGAFLNLGRLLNRYQPVAFLDALRRSVRDHLPDDIADSAVETLTQAIQGNQSGLRVALSAILALPMPKYVAFQDCMYVFSGHAMQLWQQESQRRLGGTDSESIAQMTPEVRAELDSLVPVVAQVNEIVADSLNKCPRCKSTDKACPICADNEMRSLILRPVPASGDDFAKWCRDAEHALRNCFKSQPSLVHTPNVPQSYYVCRRLGEYAPHFLAAADLERVPRIALGTGFVDNLALLAALGRFGLPKLAYPGKSPSGSGTLQRPPKVIAESPSRITIIQPMQPSGLGNASEVRAGCTTLPTELELALSANPLIKKIEPDPSAKLGNSAAEGKRAWGVRPGFPLSYSDMVAYIGTGVPIAPTTPNIAAIEQMQNCRLPLINTTFQSHGPAAASTMAKAFDEAMAMLKRSPSEDDQRDGPQTDHRRFRFRSGVAELPPIQFALMELLWDYAECRPAAAVSRAEVISRLYSERATEDKGKAFDELVRRTRKSLIAGRIHDLMLECEGGFLSLKS